MRGLQQACVTALALLALSAAIGCPPARAATPFRAWDVVVETNDEPLAAWQVELRLAPGAVLVGVEGGEGPFAEPAYHDPSALQSGRIVLAAFSTLPANALPKGHVRVARLHLRAGDDPDHLASLQAAAGPNGDRLPARVFLVPVEN